MGVKENYINFEILNERFAIKSDVPKNYYLKLVDYLKERVVDIKKKVPNLSNIKVLAFAALDIVDELIKLKNATLDEEEVKLLSQLSDSLAAVIEEEE